MQALKMLFFILALILLDNNILFIKTYLIPLAYAGDHTLYGDKVKFAYDDKASSPDCSSATASAFTAYGTFITAAIGAIIATALSTAPGLQFMLKVAFSLTAVAVVVITQNMLFFACFYSFVRHPVMRDLDGKYVSCKNPKIINVNSVDSKEKTIEVCPENKYVSASDYQWPKNRVPYSDFIEVCHREAIGGFGSAVLDQREYETNLSFIKNKKNMGGDIKCATLKDGEKVTMHSIYFGASYDGDKICVNAVGIGSVNWWPQPRIGCHLRLPAPPPAMCKDSIPIKDNNNIIRSYDNTKCMSCYIANACTGTTGIFSHAQLPMTSIIVQCLKESLSIILHGCSHDTVNKVSTPSATSQVGFLNNAKALLKKSVQATLALAVALFGIKVLLGAIRSHVEVMLFIVKLALVIYFAIGGGMNYYYDELANLSLGLSDKMLDSGDGNICNFNDSDYIYPYVSSDIVLNNKEVSLYRKIMKNNTYYKTKDKIIEGKNALDPNGSMSIAELDEFLNKITFKSYAYLAIWDRLDCRILFYLGQSVTQSAAYSILSILLIIPAALFAGQIIITICILLFVMVLIMIIVWAVHIFIISLIGLTIITLFAPLFVPMCLFQITKGFFDGWIKQMITYAIYPVIIFTFLGIVFATFDKLYFDDLKFRKVIDTETDKARSIYKYALNPANQCDTKDTNLACIVSGVKFVTKPLVFGINVTGLDVWKGSEHIWSQFGMLVLIGFFFWHFMKTICGLAAELAGDFRANIGGQITNPTAMAHDVLAQTALATKSLASKIKSKVKGDKKDDNKKDDNKKQREGISGGSSDSKGDSDDSKSSSSNGKSRELMNLSDMSLDKNEKSSDKSANSSTTESESKKLFEAVSISVSSSSSNSSNTSDDGSNTKHSYSVSSTSNTGNDANISVKHSHSFSSSNSSINDSNTSAKQSDSVSSNANIGNAANTSENKNVKHRDIPSNNINDSSSNSEK